MSDFDKPLERGVRHRLHWRRGRDSDGFGRFAEATARFMGSPKFVLYMTVFVVAWIAANMLLVKINEGAAWDPYPFILLNLAFSTQASYSAPLILLAQNRQEARDKASLDGDRRVNAQSRADMDYLAREIASLRAGIGDMATRDFVRSELRDQLHELLFELEHGNSPDDESSPSPEDAQ